MAVSEMAFLGVGSHFLPKQSEDGFCPQVFLSDYQEAAGLRREIDNKGAGVPCSRHASAYGSHAYLALQVLLGPTDLFLS